MNLSAFDLLSADHFTMLHLAARIEETLSRPATSLDLQQAAYEIIDANDRLIRPHLEREERVLLSVLREHAASDAATLEEARLQAGLISETLLFLRQAVELGGSLRGILEDVEWALRAYVDHEEKHLLPWAQQVLGPALQAEVERRYDEIVSPPVQSFEAK